ncbi:MAG: hypothetical protein J6V76_08400 [Bacteroidales bacterium]|nr:hypothetical protein [Bacteroidales bacterium]
MTNDVLLDTDDFDDDFFNEIGKQQSEPDEQEHLNEAYDRVSSNGAMPDPAAYGFGETGRELDDPFSNHEMSDFGTESQGGYDSEFGGAYNSSEYEGGAENDDDLYGGNEDEDDKDLTLIQLLNSKHVPAKRLLQKIVKPMLFIVVMSIIVTTYNRIVETDLSTISRLTKQVENIKGESIILTNELARFCKESEVAERVESQALGIHVRKEPSQYFVATKYNRPDSLLNEQALFDRHRKQLQKKQQINTAQ